MDPRIWIRLLAYSQRPPVSEAAHLAPGAFTRGSDAACLERLQDAVQALIREGGGPRRQARLVLRPVGATTGFDVLTGPRVVPARQLTVRLRGAGVDCSYGPLAGDASDTRPHLRISFDDADVLSGAGEFGRVRFDTIEQLGQHVLDPLLAH